MTFPDPLNVKAELAFGADLSATPGEWSWTDVSDRLKVSEGVGRERGRPDESGRVNPSRLTIVLGNDDGAFTPGNAASPHYPNVRRGVPVRVSLPDDAPDPKTLIADAFDRTIDGAWGNPDTGVEWQRVTLFGDEGDQPTPSVDGSAGLLTLDGTPNIRLAMVGNVGVVDADCRVMVGLNEVPTGTDEQVQVELYYRSRYQAALQFRTDGSISARLDRADGVPSLGALLTDLDRTRIVDHTGTGLTFTGSETYEVRIQAEGSTHRLKVWESGTSEPGSWLWEHDDDTYASGVVALGCWTGGSQTNDPLVWSFDDLAVTELAAPPLFLGRVVEWAPQWPSGDIGDYSRVRLVAGGVLRQQGQRTKRARSALFYGVTGLPANLADNVIAYWPCEESEGSGAIIAPGFAGLQPMSVSGDVEFGADAPLVSTEALPRLNSGDLSGTIPAYDDVIVGGGRGVDLTFLLQVPSSGLNDGQRIALLESSGDVASVEAVYVAAGGGEVQITITDDSGGTSQVTSSGFDMDGELLRFDLGYAETDTSPGNTFGGVVIHRIASDGTVDPSFDNQPVSISGLWDKAHSFQIGGGLGDAIVGHVVFKNRDDVDFPYQSVPLSGYDGESAVERFARLAEATGIPAVVTGSPALSELMGPQEPGLVLDLLRECVEVDSGIMSELNTRLGLGYRARHTLYNQAPALTLDASASPAGEIQNPFEPILNDLDIVNDVTVSRRGGSSARVLDQDSIDAEGRYDEQVTVNAHTDSQLEGLASWRLHLGTWGGMRYPTLSPALSAVGSLIPGWVALDLGDRIRVEGLPSQHPAGAVDLLVQGTSDTLTPTGWDGSGNMSPEGPYHIATVGGGDEYGRIGSDGCQTAPGLLLDGSTGAYASTPDDASVDITGDIDLRCEATLDDWASDVDQSLVSKYTTTGDQRSYRLYIAAGGAVRASWSTDGTNAGVEARSSTELPPVGPGERLAVRVTVDVDNGSGGFTLTFYTAPTIAGPWTQLGDPVDNSGGGTSSVFSSTAVLEIGSVTEGTLVLTEGVIHAAEVRDGIGGTVVADPDFTAQTTGATSFSDDAGLTWGVNGDAEVHGEFISGTDTELVVASTGFPWINSTDHASDFPFEIRVGGAVLEVTAVDVNAQIQTMTVTQTPVNGVEKTIPDGSAVQVARPVYIGL